MDPRVLSERPDVREAPYHGVHVRACTVDCLLEGGHRSFFMPSLVPNGSWRSLAEFELKIELPIGYFLGAWRAER